MRQRFYYFLSIVILFYTLINYYIGRRIVESVVIHVSPALITPFWALLFFLVFAYTIGRTLKIVSPKTNADFLIVSGAYWMGATVYFLFVFASVDLLNAVSGIKGLTLINYTSSPWPGITILGLMGALISYGTWSARTPKVSKYQVRINKNAGELPFLRIVAASDLHLGSLISNGRISQLVDKINSLEPDLIVFPGDIVDDDVDYVINNHMLEPFIRLRARYGVFGVTGNHEYIGGHADRIAEELEKAGVKMLRDQTVLVNNSFYLAGREDYVYEQFTGTPRMTIDQLLTNIDIKKPVIVLDHQPNQLQAHKEAGVDLQISGHTHRGQMYPFHLITRKIFKIDWGCLKEDSFYTIVSSGFGTWGPPIRIGNRSEIVKINISFKE